jgi:hypothetical protein
MRNFPVALSTFLGCHFRRFLPESVVLDDEVDELSDCLSAYKYNIRQDYGWKYSRLNPRVDIGPLRRRIVNQPRRLIWLALLFLTRWP